VTPAPMTKSELAATELRQRVALGKEAIARAAALPREQRPSALAPASDAFAGVTGLPEVTRDTLTAHHLASAILHHGGLVVRGLISPESVARLRSHLAQKPGTCECMTADAVLDVLSVYRDLGSILGDYLGEPPLALLQRTKVKRDMQQFGLRWHQDAPLFGGERRAANFWTALTPVGAECPGLSLLPIRMTRVIAPDYDLGDPKDRRGDEAFLELASVAAPASPVLAAGDAIVFDEMTLHETQALPWKFPYREVAVTWFFAASRFPQAIGERRGRSSPLWLG
jgi:hypothetical protein